VDEEIKKLLAGIVGNENCTDRVIDMVSYSYDASDHSHRPDAAVWVSNTLQVSQILMLANQHGFPVIPRGAGTSLTGAAVPVAGAFYWVSPGISNLPGNIFSKTDWSLFRYLKMARSE